MVYFGHSVLKGLVRWFCQKLLLKACTVCIHKVCLVIGISCTYNSRNLSAKPGYLQILLIESLKVRQLADYGNSKIAK